MEIKIDFVKNTKLTEEIKISNQYFGDVVVKYNIKRMGVNVTFLVWSFDGLQFGENPTIYDVNLYDVKDAVGDDFSKYFNICLEGIYSQISFLKERGVDKQSLGEWVEDKADYNMIIYFMDKLQNKHVQDVQRILQ